MISTRLRSTEGAGLAARGSLGIGGWALLAAILWAAGPARAGDGEQLYFVGRIGPAGSLAGAGMDRSVASLRWDLVEGQLPADLVAFRLLRDGRELARPALGAVARAADIDRLYARPEHARRRAVLAAALAADPRPGDGVSLGASVEARLRAAARDPALQMWARTLARQDIVLAWAWGRAFIDPDPPAAPAVYRLEGVGPAGETVRLGELTLSPERSFEVPAPQGLRQVTELDRCDAPESARTHGVVALDWDHPGEGAAERFGNGLMIAGYDIYRSAAAEDRPLARDLRALAARARLDPEGRPVLPGLERVNRVPVVIAGRPPAGPDGLAQDGQRSGWNPAFAQWTETGAAIAAAGLAPGDRRTYHVVPLDVTGQYGDTATIEVVVPDTRPPPAPWGVEAVPQAGNQRAATLALTWPALDPANYHAAHADGRAWCNLDTAAQEGRLRFAAAGEGCDAAVEVVLNPLEYIVYRFDDAVLAGRFSDSDGDGVSDAAEQLRGRGPDGAVTILPGTACDPGRQPPELRPQPHFVIPASAAELSGGRRRLRWVDPQPALEPGQVYWYRVAARGRNGRMSPLGPPVRARFPRTDKPAPPSAAQLVLHHCPPYAEALPAALPGVFAVDQTGLAARARLTCQLAAQAAPEGLASRRDVALAGEARLVSFGEQALVRAGDGRVAHGDGLQCPLLADAGICSGWFVEFLDDDGDRIAAAPVAADPAGPACSFTARLARDCAVVQAPVTAETVVMDGPVVLTAQPEPAHCVEVMLRLGGAGYRLTTLCPGDWPYTFEGAGLGDDLLCLSVAAVDAEADRSTELVLPCVQTAARAAPRAPRLRGLSFDPEGGAEASLRWLTAEDPGLGILAEWWVQGAADGARQAGYFDHEGRGGPDHPHRAAVALSPLGEAAEVWCVRARTLSRGPAEGGARVSEWSSTWCGERPQPGAPAPSALPWPAEPPVPALPPLPARVIAPDQVMAVFLGRPGQSAWPPGGCTVPDQPPLTPCDGQAACAAPRAWEAHECDLCPRLQAALGPHGRVVVYRQHRAGPGAAESDFVQVSPLLDGPFCARRCGRAQGGCDERAGPLCGPPGSVVCVERFADPYLRVLAFPPGDPWPERALVFLDRAPFQSGRQYRYQLVSFDAHGEPVGRRDTGWLSVEGSL